MTDKICKNCKWWVSREDADIQLFVDESEPGRAGVRYPPGCGHEKMEPIYPTDDAIWTAHGKDGICCGPNFGCIHWEEKDACNTALENC